MTRFVPRTVLRAAVLTLTLAIAGTAAAKVARKKNLTTTKTKRKTKKPLKKRVSLEDDNETFDCCYCFCSSLDGCFCCSE